MFSLSNSGKRIGGVLLACGLAVSVFVSTADAALIQFREGGGTFQSNPVTTTTFDDVVIGIGGAPLVNTASNPTISVNGSQVRLGLIAVKDLFTLLPKTSGTDVINITSATLYLVQMNGSATYTLGVSRVTTDWLLAGAGANESDVDGDLRNISGNLPWVGGSFSSSDYTAVGSTTGPWTSDFNVAMPFDITDIVADMYATETNYGVVVQVVSGGTSAQGFGTSERSTLGQRPLIAIEYTYEPAEIPEPASLALLAVGGTLIGAARRRRIQA